MLDVFLSLPPLLQSGPLCYLQRLPHTLHKLLLGGLHLLKLLLQLSTNLRAARRSKIFTKYTACCINFIASSIESITILHTSSSLSPLESRRNGPGTACICRVWHLSSLSPSLRASCRSGSWSPCRPSFCSSPKA